MEQKLRPIVRIRAADVEGNVKTINALRKVNGVSHSFANAICAVLKLDKDQKVGALSDKQLKEIEETILNPKEKKIPSWLFNRQKDYDTNEDQHLTHIDLKLRKEFDIKSLRKTKSYKGMRHGSGLTLRGQRTRGHFRRSGKALGVRRKKKSGKTG